MYIDWRCTSRTHARSCPGAYVQLRAARWQCLTSCGDLRKTVQTIYQALYRLCPSQIGDHIAVQSSHPSACLGMHWLDTYAQVANCRYGDSDDSCLASAGFCGKPYRQFNRPLYYIVHSRPSCAGCIRWSHTCSTVLQPGMSSYMDGRTPHFALQDDTCESERRKCLLGLLIA